ncbi:hypothetical protein GobsT_13690 [Gemmata obscuriglobus]|uniref:DDE domain-containing protein n=1 Tax=Gemmata obscuriglobus TaxID=114 RepID=A0A2Z3H094_9BACT|nr:hypothetical protein [Gemmata obscuriglobus]AWM40189.1 hypothetical protein C1280_26420 [Gemmata obscuriglobus]QEG26626.1 hypothetical protein GobsT_13690 [Gemmata obscuriglobus]VTS02167.1 transposase : Transposase family protein OS=Pseudomonas sp. GM102 GN=PMI18_05641 PE=4 SV=1 [Gemmata obscuriglobus UQM 2246]
MVTEARSAGVTVRVAGGAGTLWVAEVPVVLDRPGRNRVGGGKRVRTPGAPLRLRLIVSWVLGPDGRVLAEWFLLNNAPLRFAAATVACWYAWCIESDHKLLKTAGMNAGQWQQQTGEAVARRLVVASTACLSVW